MLTMGCPDEHWPGMHIGKVFLVQEVLLHQLVSLLIKQLNEQLKMAKNM